MPDLQNPWKNDLVTRKLKISIGKFSRKRGLK